MTDLERRLRDALRAAAEPAPPGLLGAVLRRHRRHQVKVGASVLAVAVAAALAVPPVTSALRSAGRAPAGTGQVAPTPTPSSRARHGLAAPGTVLSGCNGADQGSVGRLKRPRPARLPLWFLPGGHSSGRIRLYVAIAVLRNIRPGSVVVVRVPQTYQHDLRLLYGPADSLNPGTKYSMRSGETGVTFEACSPPGPTGGITDYYGGYLVRGKRCVPVRVWSAGSNLRGTIRLGTCSRR